MPDNGVGGTTLAKAAESAPAAYSGTSDKDALIRSIARALRVAF